MSCHTDPAILASARAALAEGRAREARTLFARSLIDTPGSGVAMKGMGRALIATEFDPTPGERALRRAWIADPDDPGPLFDLAARARAAGRPDGAMAMMELVLSRTPEHRNARLALMSDAARAGRVGRARHACRVALCLAPDDPHTLSLAADFHLNHVHPEAAAALYRRLIALGGSAAPARTRIGDAMVYQGRFAEGMIRYRGAVVEMEPLQEDAWRGVGDSLARVGDMEGAVAALSRSHRLDPSDDRRPARDRGNHPVLLVAMQKSASEYLHQLLVEAYNLPPERLSVGTVPHDRIIPPALERLVRQRGFARSHLDAGPENVAGLLDSGIQRIAITIRDPRQVAISWSHMIAAMADNQFHYARDLYRPRLPVDFRARTLTEQLAWTMGNYFPTQVDWLGGWLDASHRFRGAMEIRFFPFERFVREPDSHLRDLADFFALPPGPALARLATLKPASTRNFRSGRLDEWREVLSDEQRRAAIERLRHLQPYAALTPGFPFPVDDP